MVMIKLVAVKAENEKNLCIACMQKSINVNIMVVDGWMDVLAGIVWYQKFGMI